LTNTNVLSPETTIPWGSTGEAVYKRTYSRKKPDGTNEIWPETVERVVSGNLALVHGTDRGLWSDDVIEEAGQLTELMEDFKILPAGRHLWSSGVKGRQYLFNCHVAGWGKSLSDHFDFTFLRLMEGGGVGANYSSRFLAPFGAPRRELAVHIVCDPEHADYAKFEQAGLLSSEYDSDWDGAFEVEDSREGWSAALVDLIDTFMQDEQVAHEKRVYDVSRVRPEGSRLKTFGGTASGPVPFAAMMTEVARVMNVAAGRVELTDIGSWGLGTVRTIVKKADHLTPVEAMEIDHAIAECVVSGGTRRSARMAIVSWDDPFIEDFLACKADGVSHWTTNISVEINDDFTSAIEKNTDKGTRARWIFERVVKGMLTNGEPGLWNSSLSNVGEVNEVIATNPCGEIALEAWENCNLGHVNLDAFAPKVKGGPGDVHGLMKAHQLMTRFLIRATYGDVNDPKQAEKLALNRRIGVGHFGVQGYFAKSGVPYSQVPWHRGSAELLKILKNTVRNEARKYAFELRIPEPVKVTTVAPTGSIAKLPGVAEGIHPIYARTFERRVRYSMIDPDQMRAVREFEEQGFEVEVDQYDASGNTSVVVFPTKEVLVQQVEDLGYPATFVESADELTVKQMLAFQAMYQTHYADNAVSYTLNVPAEAHQLPALAVPGTPVPVPSPERVQAVSVALRAQLPYLKGTTMMLDGSRPQAPYTRITEEQYSNSLAVVLADGVDEDCANGACPVR